MPSSITLGYAPIISAAIVEQRSEALVRYFKQQHQLDINFHHSNNFKAYLSDAIEHKFDLAISQINYAEAFSSQLGFTPILKSSRQYHVLVLSQKNSDIETLAQLKGHTVGVPQGLSFISTLFQKSLAEAGLSIPLDVQLVPFKRHDQLFMSLLKHRIEAGITVEITLDMAKSLTEHLKVIHRIPAGPAVLSLSSKLSDAQQQWLQQALLAFSQTPAGEKYLKAIAFDHFEPSSYQQLAPYRKLAAPLHKEISQQQHKEQTMRQ
jgi:ABC-type phosphate/phosphonate transport system substrate-binding protein